MVKVAVPKPDEEGMSSFFQSVSLDKLQSQKVEVAEAAFNAIASESRQLYVDTLMVGSTFFGLWAILRDVLSCRFHVVFF